MVYFIGFMGISAMAIGIDLALTKEGRLKVGEKSLPSSIQRDPPHTIPERLLPYWALDTLEVALSLRGLGWQYGKHIYVAREYRSMDRSTFMRATAIFFVKHYLVLDICLVILKMLPGIGDPNGGSLFYSNLPPLPRLVVALLITLLSLVTLISGMQTTYSLLTLFGVGVLLQSPSQWPPIMVNPLVADSMHDFWSRRWHQALRRTFVVLGGVPGYLVGGESGFIVGSFLASGLVHEGGVYVAGKGIDHKVTLYFVLQGIGLVSERYYRSISGRRVEGIGGRIWAAFFLIMTSQFTGMSSPPRMGYFELRH